MKRNILPYEEKVVEELNNCNQHYRYEEYSVPWINESLDREKLKNKYGKNWNTCPSDIQEYYRAEGYMHAVVQISRKKIEGVEISCNVKEILLQEISKELEQIVLKVLSHHL